MLSGRVAYGIRVALLVMLPLHLMWGMREEEGIIKNIIETLEMLHRALHLQCFP